MISKIKSIYRKYDGVALDGILLSVIRIITLFVSILQTMYLSRALSLNEYGVYSELLIVISIGVTVTSFGLSNSISYFFNIDSGSDNKKQYINNIFSLTFITGIIGAIICLLFRNNISNFYKDSSIIPLIIYIILRPLTNNIISLYDPLYISLKKSKIIAVRNLIVSFLKVIFIPITYILTKDIKWILIVQLLLDIVQIIYFNFNVRKYIKKINYFSFNIDIIKKILKYSIPLYLATICGTLFKEFDKLIIGHLSTTDNLAIYTNMSKQLPFEFIVTSFSAVITPIMVKYLNKDKKKAVNLWKKFLELSYKISWILVFGALVCSKELLLLLYSKTYLSGLNIFIVYLITEIFKFTYFGLILSSSGNTRYITISSVVSLILNIILNIIFYNIYGMIGPAFATLITTILMGSFQLFMSIKILSIKLCDVISMKDVLRTFLLLLLSGIIFFMLKIILYKFINNYLIIILIIYSSYIILNYLFFHKKILSLIKEIK